MLRFGFLDNYPLIAAIAAIVLGQFVKVPLYWLSQREWDWKRFVGTGGMPSSHSAGVTALATSIACEHGVRSTDFALACVLGMVVMYDAMGIRRHAGYQAMAINELEREFEQHIKTGDPDYSRRSLQRRHRHLKEMLGHQPREVAGGAVFGIVMGLLFRLLYV